ncbi:MAG: response regulator [Patescibacteria group bacterium]|jgi:DNA-binding response OmpR family regulator
MVQKVLIIEDDLSLLKIYTNKLKLNGFEVSMATTGDEGVRKAKVERPNIILLDLILPGQDGFQVLQMLKNSAETNTVPVIIMSNLAQPSDKKRAADLGAVDYLVKSDISLVDMITKVRQYIKQE